MKYKNLTISIALIAIISLTVFSITRVANQTTDSGNIVTEQFNFEPDNVASYVNLSKKSIPSNAPELKVAPSIEEVDNNRTVDSTKLLIEVKAQGDSGSLIIDSNDNPIIDDISVSEQSCEGGYFVEVA